MHYLPAAPLCFLTDGNGADPGPSPGAENACGKKKSIIERPKVILKSGQCRVKGVQPKAVDLLS